MTRVSPVLLGRGLAGGVHVLVLALLAIAVATTPRPNAIAAGIVFAAVYVAGLAPRIRHNRSAAMTWGAVLTVAWVALVLAAATGIWLAFPLFFLAAHLLTPRWAALVVSLLTTIAIVGFAWHQGWTVGGVLGPILGAAVALTTVAGLRLVDTQSRARGITAERDRLAHEIHDTLAQGLNSIHLLLSAAEERWDSDPAEARSLVRRARTSAQGNLEETRRFVQALRPPDLATRSLSDALARLAERTDLPTTFTAEGTSIGLPGGVEVALLRIAQEALSNVSRHAQATRAALTLSYMDDQVSLDIVDDGIGGAVEVGGVGMSSMRRRAESLGGRFVVESASSGTAIAVAIPLAAQGA